MEGFDLGSWGSFVTASRIVDRSSGNLSIVKFHNKPYWTIIKHDTNLEYIAYLLRAHLEYKTKHSIDQRPFSLFLPKCHKTFQR